MRMTGHLTIQEGGRRRGRPRARRFNMRPRETCADPDLMFNNINNDRKDDEDL